MLVNFDFSRPFFAFDGKLEVPMTTSSEGDVVVREALNEDLSIAEFVSKYATSYFGHVRPATVTTLVEKMREINADPSVLDTKFSTNDVACPTARLYRSS
ncbi:MAG: hypothetical protein SP1CHLAM54_02880 [Chlamydiia bacterium]|nr:hypothetical protein [Chlamydiia bacterium]MCH9615204.1 hypothetical protein [Chlamydiia bacterium]MCH9628474.1 hypothetical protein [Chlamydiia bacterium]